MSLLLGNLLEEADKYNVYKEVDGERVLVGTPTEPTITVDTPEEKALTST